jgi:hypothetical protein
VPEIKKSGMNGCCVGGYFYDLGGAHNKYRSKNIEEFALRFCELGQSVVNFATTNESQGPEREFLEQLGFKQIFHHGNMYAHVVSGQDLDKHLQPFKLRKAEIEREKAEKRRREEEERRKKLAEQQEKERLKRIEQEKKELAKIKLAKVTSNEDVTLEWIREQYNRYPTISVQTLFNELFGFQKLPPYERKWDDEALLRSINSRLRKRREVAAQKVAKKKK